MTSQIDVPFLSASVRRRTPTSPTFLLGTKSQASLASDSETDEDAENRAPDDSDGAVATNISIVGTKSGVTTLTLMVTGKQLAEFRLLRAVVDDRVLSFPEMVMMGQSFLKSNFVDEARSQTLLEWFFCEPTGHKILDAKWFEKKGADWVAFTRRFALPPWTSPTQLLEKGLPTILPENGSLAPRFVRGSTNTLWYLENLTPRDIAYMTAGTTVTPKVGGVYGFFDIYPCSKFTLEDACRANGFTEARTRFFKGDPSSGYRPRRILTSPPPRAFPNSLLSLPEPPSPSLLLTPASPPPPGQGSPPTSSPPRWGSSSTYLGSSLPPSEFESESEKDTPPHRDWVAEKRVQRPPGRFLQAHRPGAPPRPPPRNTRAQTPY